MTNIPEPAMCRPAMSGACLVVASLVCLLSSGCISSESIYRDVSASRGRAYRAWRQSYEQGGSDVSLGGRLSLADALKLALVHNKALQAVTQGKEIARGRAMELRSEALPKVTALGNYTRLDDFSTFDVGGKSIALGPLNNYSVDLEVRQPVFHGGAVYAAARAAAVVSCLSDARVRGQVQETIYQVAKAYYDMLLAQRLFKVNEDAVKSAQAHLKDVKARRGQGTASNYDVLRAEVDASNFKAEMIRQRNRIHLSRTRLLRAMGVSQVSKVTLSGDLTYRPFKPVLTEAVRQAYHHRPDLHQAELDMRLQQEAVRYAKSQFWPQVDAVFTQGWARPDPHTSMLDEWDNQWTGGISMSIPIFDGFQRRGRLIKERATLRQKEIRLLDAQERALLQVRQALLSLRDAEELVESQRLNLKRATEGLRLAEASYREGMSTEVMVTDARSALTRTRGLHYQSIYAHAVARLDLERFMGMLGPQTGKAQGEKAPAADQGHVDQPAPRKEKK